MPRRALWVALAITLSPMSLLAQGGTSSAADASRGKNAKPVMADLVTIKFSTNFVLDSSTTFRDLNAVKMQLITEKLLKIRTYKSGI